MSYQVLNCEQGSDEWKRARAGVITASMFKVARARLKSGPNKGDFTEAGFNYAFRLAIERISGEPLDEGFETWQMRRGHELEPRARQEHEVSAGVIVERAGFVFSEDFAFGASADGFFEEQAKRKGCEYKCLVSPEGLRNVLIEGDISEFTDQVQGGMWLTGLDEWHFGLFCPALAPIGRQFDLHVVKRDDNYIAALETDLLHFKELVDRFERRLRATPSANTEQFKAAA